MPGGKIHSALTLAVASGVLAPYFLVQFGGNPYAYTGGCVTGVLITPDMDVDAGNISDTFIRKVSRPAQAVWRVFWSPYALAVPHRHFISHFPVVGTVLRIGYIFLIINLLSLLSHMIFDTVSRFYWIWDWSFFFGLVHVDTIHWFADSFIRGKETFESG